MARIVVVDDVPEIVAGIVGILEAAGHEALGAMTAPDVLGLLSARPADIVVTDIFMPDRDGLELITDLRNRYPGLKILVMSGGSRHFPPGEFLTIAQRLGADGVLGKPFNSAALLNAVSVLLGSNQMKL